jgi:hypothetical protein
MADLLTVVVSSLVGGVVGAGSAILKNSLSARSKVDQHLRDERLTHYRVLWKKTGLIPKWPKADDVTYDKLDKLTKELRDWYYDGGGICLSAQAREAYTQVQKLLNKVLVPHKGDLSKRISPEDYDSLAECCSALRTELTQDLLSRKRALLIGD